ncbi:MAG: cation transporting ATPase C-terminal domain-containing protein, partial [Victivallaceae bacterium]
LLDDSFRSIVNAVLWGRSLYLNIQKFLVFQLTINVAAAGIAIMGPFVGVSMPLTVIQMLWINLIMDTFAALALATEPPTPEVMNKPPRHPGEFIISGPMALNIFGMGLLFMAIFFFAIKFWGADGIDQRELTIIFSSFVLLQFWNLLNVRAMGSNKSMILTPPNNPVFAWIAVLILGGQILITQFGGRMFRTEPLPLHDWLLIIGGTSWIFLLGETVRFLKRAKSKLA